MNISIEIDSSLICNALNSAFEGGIAYWARVQRDKPAKQRHLRALDPLWRSEGDWSAAPLCGGSVLIHDRIADTMHVLGRAEIKRGLLALAADFPQQLTEIIVDNADATTGDILVQCSIFGEVRYG